MSPALELAPPLPADAPRPSPGRKGRVLLADDDDRARGFLARTLANHGYEVSAARHGGEALALAERHPPDLAIVELGLPRMNGFEVVRALKTSYGPTLPVFVLSGCADPEDRVQAFDVGADDFLSKPVFMPELLRRIDAFERTRRAYLEVREANARADRLRVFATEAAALLAHDLNNGLTVALANLEYVRLDGELEGDVAEALEATMAAQRRMAALVRNFVDISRMEDAALVPERTTVNIRNLLDAAGKVHGPGIAATGATLSIVAAPDVEAEVDPVLLERVLHNLVGNAARYVDTPGKVALRARIDELRDELIIEVSNTGPRIPDSKRGTLFEKYGTADSRSLRGMGLYFCRLACEAHGGSIGLIEASGFATTFAVRLPRR